MTHMEVLYQDDALLVLEKPAGLLCVPGRGPDKQDSLSGRAQQHWPGALVVHRLDQATSGLVVMALNADAQRGLGHAFEQRKVRKRYQAIVQGSMQDRDGGRLDSDNSDIDWEEITLPIAADWENRPLRVIDAVHGKPSITRWRVILRDAAGNTTRVELAPITGRTHQLRVHLAAVGHAIVGDLLYGSPNESALAPRLYLHASEIGFEHPQTSQALQFISPAPF